jgi:hypothetical protein
VALAALNLPRTRARATFGPSLGGQVARPQPLVGIRRHLVIAYRPGWQSLEDLNTMAGYVRDIDPTIRTFLVPTTHRNPITRREVATKPTLVVSNGRMTTFRPVRGKVYQGWPIPKIEEVRRLQLAGLPVPRTEILTPELKLDPADWGEFVIVKPTDIATSSHGLGIKLMRTSRVRYIAPRDYPQGHPGRLGPMLVQQFIDTGERLTTYRLLMFFGEPLYVQLNIGAGGSKASVDDEDAKIESSNIALQAADTREAYIVDAPDVVALGRAIHAAVPEIPLKGCDFLREAGTGKLYLIELNAGGNTWHFSSAYGQKLRDYLGPEFERQRRTQFDALRTAARVMAEMTNAEAV